MGSNRVTVTMVFAGHDLMSLGLKKYLKRFAFFLAKSSSRMVLLFPGPTMFEMSASQWKTSDLTVQATFSELITWTNTEMKEVLNMQRTEPDPAMSLGFNDNNANGNKVDSFLKLTRREDLGMQPHTDMVYIIVDFSVTANTIPCGQGRI